VVKLIALLKKCGVVLMLSWLCAVIFNAVMPQGVGFMPDELLKPLWRPATILDTWELFKNGAMFIDSRSSQEYEQGHILWAFNFSPMQAEMMGDMLAPAMVKDQEIVVYGRTASRWPAAVVAQMMRKKGFHKIYVMDASFEQWAQAGYPHNAEAYTP